MGRIQVALKMSLLFFLLASVLPGCATVVKGTTQAIPVDSDPNNADVIVDGNLKGQTPLSLELKRKRDHLITIEKTGYHSKGIPVVKHVGGAVWGNLILGGLIGWGVDASTGAQYNLSPTSVYVKLIPKENGEDDSEDARDQSTFVRKLNELDVLKDESKISDEEYAQMRTALFKEYYPEMEFEPVDK